MIEIFERTPYAGVAEERPLRSLDVVGTAGELVSRCVDVRSSRGETVLEISVTDLSGDSFPLPAKSVQVLVRSGDALLTDNTRCPHGHYRQRFSFRHWRVYPHYRAPLVPRAPTRARLECDRPLTLWVFVRIPSFAKPGKYRAKIELHHDGKPLVSLPLQLQVLPFLLSAPDRSLGLWYKGTLDERRPRHFVTETQMRAQLADIFEAGFRLLSLSETSRRLADRARALAREAGFVDDIVWLPPYPKRRRESAEATYCLSDEIEAHGRAELETHFRNEAIARRRRARTMCSVLELSLATALFAWRGSQPDKVITYLPRNRDYFYLAAHFRELPRAHYYWLAQRTSPALNRVLAGAWLWHSGAAGIFPYSYSHRPPLPDCPWSGGRGDGPDAGGALVFPTTDSGLPSERWCALRDGITDLRYLTTAAKLVPRSVRASLDALDVRNFDFDMGADTESLAEISVTIRKSVTRAILVDQGGRDAKQKPRASIR